MKKHLYLLIAAVMALLFSFTACGGDGDVKVKGVTLNKAAASIAVNATETLIVNFEPENPKNKTVSWASSNTSVATVTDGGTVRGVAPGTSNITVATEDGDFKAACVVTVFIPPATGVALSKTSTSIVVSLDERLTATVTPSGANQTVTWQSSNIAVAQVARAGNGDGSATVIAVGAGTANITAIASNGVVSADPCVVTVTPNNIVATGVIVSPAMISLIATTQITPDSDATVQLDTAIEPPNAPGGSIVWSTSDSARATVSPTGLVRAIAAGEVDITATTGSVSGTCHVTIAAPVRVTGVTVTPATATIDAGQTQRLTATVAPATATYPGYTWSSSNPAIATVSATGLVSAVSDGSVTIRATTTDGGHQGSCALTINKVPATAVAISPAKAEILSGGGVKQLTAVFTPSYGGYDTITWSSSDASRAVITGAGSTVTVTGVGLGDATITVTATVGAITLPAATCAVSVVDKLSTPDVFFAGSYTFDPIALWGQITETTTNSYWLDSYLYDVGEAFGIHVTEAGAMYIAGHTDWSSWEYYHDPQPVIWRGTDDFIPLAQPNGPEDGTGIAYGVAVDAAGNVIAVGEHGWFYAAEPCVWINYNTLNYLPSEIGEGRAMSIAISGADTYIAGEDWGDDYYGNFKAALWKNGVKTRLHPTGGDMISSRARSVAVSGSNVYVAGWVFVGDEDSALAKPYLWTSANGGTSFTAQQLPITQGNRALPYSVAVDDSDVFVAGYELNADSDIYCAVVWINGTPHYPEGPLSAHTRSTGSQARGVSAFSGKAYACGFDKDHSMVVWNIEEGTAIKIPAPLVNGDPLAEGGCQAWALFTKAR